MNALLIVLETSTYWVFSLTQRNEVYIELKVTKEQESKVISTENHV